MNFNIRNISAMYEEVVNLVIRPVRCKYNPETALGPKVFSLDKRIYEREDFHIKNGRGMKVQCSMYQPIASQRPAEKMPCVIYCHGNCGSRCDALDAVQVLLPFNINVVALDFSGSGLSDGDYVSLGFYEKQDLDAVCNHLWQTGRVSRVGLWGRSMGAATSVMYAAMNYSIAGMVCDSPFTSLEDVMRELVLSHYSWVPKRLIKIGISVMRKSIISRAAFDIRKNNPLEHAKRAFVPALFAHAKGDDFIKVHHSEKICAAYSGDKNIILFDGDHNSERPDFFYDSVAIFFYNTLIANTELDNVVHPTGSIARKMGVGKATEKGRLISEIEDNVESDGADVILSDTEAVPEEDADIPRNVGTLSTSAAQSQPQVVLPSTFTTSSSPKANRDESSSSSGSSGGGGASGNSHISGSSARHEDIAFTAEYMDDEDLLIHALIESIQDRLKTCTEGEKPELEARLAELTRQAKAAGSQEEDESSVQCDESDGSDGDL